MNKIKKMFVKNEFFKAIEGYSTNWDDLSLYYLNGIVCLLNKMIKDDLTLFLSKIVGKNIIIKLEYSDNNSLAFFISDRSDEKYVLANGEVLAVGAIYNKNFLDKLVCVREQLEIFNRTYVELMSEYGCVNIPLTERVNFCYDFFRGTYFFLKDKKRMNKGTRIIPSYNYDNYLEDENDCYISWRELDALTKRIRISSNYKKSIEALGSSLDEKLKNLKVNLGLDKNEEMQDKEIVSDEEDLDSPRFLIREDNLFEIIDGVKCVREEWQRNLRYLDLANISFEGVYIAGLDFTHSNAVINPNLVYNKDLSNCKFDDRYFTYDVNLDECNTSGMIVGDIVFGEKKRGR